MSYLNLFDVSSNVLLGNVSADCRAAVELLSLRKVAALEIGEIGMIDSAAAPHIAQQLR